MDARAIRGLLPSSMQMPSPWSSDLLVVDAVPAIAAHLRVREGGERIEEEEGRAQQPALDDSERHLMAINNSTGSALEQGKWILRLTGARGLGPVVAGKGLLRHEKHPQGSPHALLHHCRHHR